MKTNAFLCSKQSQTLSPLSARIKETDKLDCLSEHSTLSVLETESDTNSIDQDDTAPYKLSLQDLHNL